MNYFLLPALIIVIIAFAWLAFKYVSLRRRLDRFSRTVRKITEDDLRVTDLPEDENGLEEL